MLSTCTDREPYKISLLNPITPRVVLGKPRKLCEKVITAYALTLGVVSVSQLLHKQFKRMYMKTLEASP